MVILLFFIIIESIHCWFTPWVVFTILRLPLIIYDFPIIHYFNTLSLNNHYHPPFMIVPWYLDKQTWIFISLYKMINVNWNVYVWVQIITMAAPASTVIDIYYLSHSPCLPLWHSHVFIWFHTCTHMTTSTIINLDIQQQPCHSTLFHLSLIDSWLSFTRTTFMRFITIWFTTTILTTFLTFTFNLAIHWWVHEYWLVSVSMFNISLFNLTIDNSLFIWLVFFLCATLDIHELTTLDSSVIDCSYDECSPFLSSIFIHCFLYYNNDTTSCLIWWLWNTPCFLWHNTLLFHILLITSMIRCGHQHHW